MVEMAKHLHQQEKRRSSSCPCKSLPLNLSSFTAAEYGDLHRLAELPSNYVNKTDSGGYTPLHLSAQNGHTAATALLLKAGANVDHNTTCGATPLHRASFAGAITTMKLLLDAGANLLLKDTSFGDCRTPLHKAAAGGRHLAVKLLLDTAAAARGDNHHRHPLQQQQSSLKLQREALETLDARGMTPLQVAREMQQSDYAAEHQSVKRWDVVATCAPDWNQCVALLEHATSQQGGSNVTGVLAAAAAVPRHITSAQSVSCWDCETTSDGRCQTASWEAAFRSMLVSSLDESMSCTVESGFRKKISVQDTCMNSSSSSSDDQRLSKLQQSAQVRQQSVPAEPQFPRGKQCSSCGIESFAFFRVNKEQLVCKVCLLKAKRNRLQN